MFFPDCPRATSLCALALIPCITGCWFGREIDECSDNTDCPSGEICWTNDLGDNPIRICVPPEFLEEAGLDAGQDLDGGNDDVASDLTDGESDPPDMRELDAADTETDSAQVDATDADVDGRADDPEPDTSDMADMAAEMDSPTDRDSEADPDVRDDDPELDMVVDTADMDAGEPPPPPTGVIASDATFPGFVNVTWNASVGADSYRVLRDGVEIASGLTSLSYSDGGADASTPSAPTLTASNNRSDGVLLTWNQPNVPNGTAHAYTVSAVNAAGASAPSASDPGFRSGPSITGYEVEVDGGDWVAEGNVLSVLDEGAPTGDLDSAGTALASEGTSLFAVELSLSGVVVSDGDPVDYRVRAINAVGSGLASSTVTGRRSAPTLQYQWQRSSGESPAGFGDIAGATSAVYDDRASTIDGTTRHYRCRVSDGTVTLSSASDSGARQIGTIPVPGGASSGITQNVGIDGNWAIVGGSTGASMWLFDVDAPGWVEDDALSPSGSHQSVELSGDFLITKFGPRIFGYSDAGGWESLVTLSPDDPDALNAGYGNSVVLHGDLAVVNAPDPDSADQTGAYLYWYDDESGWGSETKVTPEDVGITERIGFGAGIAVYNSVVAVGDLLGQTVYILDANAPGSWTLADQVGPPNGDALAFGERVRLFDNWLLATTPFGDEFGTNAGNAFVYTLDVIEGWVFEDSLDPGELDDNDRFGSTLALSATFLAIGSRNALYLFEYEDDTGWAFVSTIAQFEGTEPESVDISSDWMIANDDTTAYLFYLGD